MKSYLPYLLISLMTWISSNGQVFEAVEKPESQSLKDFVNAFFLDGGVDILNISFKGASGSIGSFSAGSSTIGIEQGLILSTGYIESVAASGPISGSGMEFASSDNESDFTSNLLPRLSDGILRNVVSLKISFIPNRSRVRFNYVFASEEYPEFGCDEFNDVFGFFIEGDGYDTPTNIALIPGTDLPVAINNIHPANPVIDGCIPFNEVLFNDNNGTTSPPVFDGWTDVFQAEAMVTPCTPYTITLEIADVRDKIYDSAVFLQARSFDGGYLTQLMDRQS